jgi:acyl-coenzyme A synthetase/AMP-(fatty) acid ligase
VPRAAFASVRLAVSAGEHLPAQVWHAVERATGLRLVNGLGSSEATNLYLSDRPCAPRPGTAGWRVAGYDLRIEADGESVREGELLVRGPTVMAGYLGDPETTARALAGGWLHTGDRVRREPDGSHTFLGRMSDRFKAGAFWVDPARVRDALAAQAGVADAVALPVRDGQGLERVGAAVVPRPGAAPGLRERLAAAAERALAPHEVPRALLVLPGLPTTASGKVDRTELVRLLQEEIAAAPVATEPVA